MYTAQAADRHLWKLSKAHVGSNDACLRSDLPASDSQGLDEAGGQGAGRHMLTEESAGWSASDSMAAEREEVRAACSGACEGSVGTGKGEEVVVGYWKQHSLLTHVVLRNAGHMVRCHLLLHESLRPCQHFTIVFLRDHDSRQSFTTSSQYVFEILATK